jgi:metal-dependent amidase/aminoacylase/carboxypeptidase family protein
MEWREYMPPYLNMVPSHSLGDAFRANLEALGRPITEHKERSGTGSTDLGNVSHHIPVSCAYLKICGPEAGWHTREVAAATRTAAGHAAIVDGAKSLAMTALDILFDASLRERAAEEHAESMAQIEA